MRPISLAILLLLAPLSAFAQDSCSAGRNRMRAATSDYNAARAQLAEAERDFAVTPGSEEAKIRTLRRYAELQRRVDDRRNVVLEVYEDLIADECDQFDQAGYDKTVANFRQASNAERDTLKAAKYRAGGIVTGVVRDSAEP